MLFHKTGLYQVLIAMFLFLGILATARAEKIIIAADQWCPYFCQSGKNFDGFSVDLLHEALKRNGLEMEYLNASFARITIQVEKGKWQIHGGTDASFTPSLLIGKEAVAFSKWVFVSKKGRNWTYEGVASLKGKVFGGISGYVYSNELMEYYDRPENKDRLLLLAGDAAQKQALMMLMSDRVDFIIEDESVVRYWAHKLRMSDKIEISGVDSEVAIYPGYRKGDAEAAALAKKVDRAIQSVKRNSAFMSQLVKKYEIYSWK